MSFTDWVYRRYVRFPKAYVDLLDRIHQHLAPRTYVEIGVSTGRSLNLVLPDTLGVGIDPDPKLDRPPHRRTQVFTMTSDDFFAHQNLEALLGNQPVDLAFIDGLHHFEFALRDFANLERHASPDSVILVHDCLPIDATTASREPSVPLEWSGDVWKLIVCLKQWRPDLKVAVADVAPTGLGIVRHLDPHSTVLMDNHDALCEQYLAMPYSALDRDKAGMLNVVDGDWETVRALLPVTPFRSYNVKAYRTRRAATGVVTTVRHFLGRKRRQHRRRRRHRRRAARERAAG